MVEMKPQINGIRAHQRFDLAPQATEAKRDHRLPQFRGRADEASRAPSNIDVHLITAHLNASLWKLLQNGSRMLDSTVIMPFGKNRVEFAAICVGNSGS
jgi:hypothetical protein